MADVNVAVEFCALLDCRGIKGRPVDRRTSANFNIVFNHHDANLRDLGNTAGARRKSKSVCADHRSCVDRAISTNLTAMFNDNIGADFGALADLGARSDVSPWIDHHTVGDFGRWIHISMRTYGLRRFWRFHQTRCSHGKSPVGILVNKQHTRGHGLGKRWADDDRCGAGFRQKFFVGSRR